MDGRLARYEQAFEQLQINLRMSAERTLRIVRDYSDEGRTLVLRTIHDNGNIETVRLAGQRAWAALLRVLQDVNSTVHDLPTPRELYDLVHSLLRDEIVRNNAFYICVGIGIGTMGGMVLGAYWSRPFPLPIMKAIACTHLHGPNYVQLCHTSMPTFGRRPCDILIRVRAATITRLDARIAAGYGNTFRRMVQRYDSNVSAELPLPLGRACAGIVEGVGPGSRSGLEIGDEVWLAAPWWEPGVATEMVVAPECRVGRKPFIIGFEGAASMPYSGCVALDALRQAGLDAETCVGKRVLVQDGCSPVGCVLTQLCNRWGAAEVAATCSVRSVPVITALGAHDVIALNVDSVDEFEKEQHVLFKELSIRPEYDVIFYTTAADYDTEFMRTFLKPRGRLVSTVEMRPTSDDSGLLGRMMLKLYVQLRRLGASVTKSAPDWGGPHLCHRSLDRLAEYVNDGVLQTVVDQVYTPQDADAAMTHVCSTKSIGSTIVTFRS